MTHKRIDSNPSTRNPSDPSERLTSTHLDFDVGFAAKQHFDDFEVAVLAGRLKGSAKDREKNVKISLSRQHSILKIKSPIQGVMKLNR